MEMIEEIGILLNQFLAFIQLADQDDNNFIEQIVRRRRYVGTWFETYHERQFKRDFRFTKPTFRVRKQIVTNPEFSY
jgi:hypothetical protein